MQIAKERLLQERKVTYIHLYTKQNYLELEKGAPLWVHCATDDKRG